MMVDVGGMVRRHAARLTLGALLVVVLACVWSTVALAQGAEQDPAPVDMLSAAIGGGGAASFGALLVGLAWLGSKLGLSMPRIVIGGKDPTPPAPEEEASAHARPAPAPGHEDHESRIRSLERKAARTVSRLTLLEDQQIRVELGLKELREVGHDLLMRYVDQKTDDREGRR
jgi:hypothetical protein